jgi:RNA polymerase sigma factor (TIGR02999 family)
MINSIMDRDFRVVGRPERTRLGVESELNARNGGRMADQGEITRLLQLARDGDPGALELLLPEVYEELRIIARRQLSPRGGRTLDTTALVHEAYIKVFGQHTPSLNDREHFFSVACLAMRQLLRDHARRRRADKRGGEGKFISFDLIQSEAATVEQDVAAFLDLDEALDRLAAVDPRLAEVVELRYFGGLSVEQVAKLKSRTQRTILRDWRKARAFLVAELEEKATETDSGHE